MTISLGDAVSPVELAAITPNRPRELVARRVARVNHAPRWLLRKRAMAAIGHSLTALCLHRASLYEGPMIGHTRSDKITQR